MQVDHTGRIQGISAAVLAGGESRRIGHDKAQEVVGNTPPVGHLLEPLQRLFSDVKIIADRPELYDVFDVDVASDVLRGKGPLGGVLSALVHADSDLCFIVSCDTPVLNEEAVRGLIRRRERQDVVVPFRKAEPQPLHALYSKRCVPFILGRIRKGDARVVDFYSDVQVLRISEEEWRPWIGDCACCSSQKRGETR